jgi:hypothetical protein
MVTEMEKRGGFTFETMENLKRILDVEQKAYNREQRKTTKRGRDGELK